MISSESRSFTISDWREAPFWVNGETVFAVGDVHGCAEQLAELLKNVTEVSWRAATARLVFLGDLICRGPNSLEALQRWSDPRLETRFHTVNRLFGNHEQLLMISIGGGPHAGSAHAKWLTIDGDTFIKELQGHAGATAAPLTRRLLVDTVGDLVVQRLDNLEKHVKIGNVIFVHGGIDPAMDIDRSLMMPWDTFADNHWAWIQEPFLSWRGGFGGMMIVHGHTPPSKHSVISGYPDPHVLQHDRLCLDAGSALTGIVAAAQIEDGRYRLLTSGRNAAS